MEIAPDIFRFDTGPFNWYVVRQGGRLTLVDAGFPGHYRVFREGLAQIGHTVADLEAIVLTHAHADHIGFAERLRKETGVPVFVHPADQAMAGRPLQLPWVGLLSNAWRPFVAQILGVAIMNGVFTLPHLKKTYALPAGAVLDVPGHPRILHTPGHTAGQVSLWFEDRQSLLCGDTLITRHLLTGADGPPQLAAPSLTHNMRQARRSLALLAELGTQTILTGHGQPWRGNLSTAIEQIAL